MIDPQDPLELQLSKQAKIIDALMRRAGRQRELSGSAYQAFQSAIELQQKVAAQSRELETVRHETERTRHSLAQALSAMEEGFALFYDGRLDVCNDLFLNLLPDVAGEVLPGLELDRYFGLIQQSRHLVSTDLSLDHAANVLARGYQASPVVSLVIELTQDRWYQMSAQVTSEENTVLLFTEITALARRNRIEKEHLIDQQADYLSAVFQNMGSGVCTFSAQDELMMQNARFREILDLPVTAVRPGVTLKQLLDFMGSRAQIADNALLQVDGWRSELRKRGFLRRRVDHGADRVIDLHANVLPDGGFLVEVKDVTLETRSTELLENRVMERTAELTRANANLTVQYQQLARIEEELRLAKERAEAAVSSKTRFLAAASHDLLQPINAAKLLISTLQETTRETSFLPMVDRLQGAFSSAEQLLHSLLDISRLESADPDTVDPAEVNIGTLIEGVRADQELVAAQKAVRLDVVPCSLTVRSDPVYLLRSIQNLVVNAVQYTKPGGRVLVGCRRKGNKVALQVWDTGIGISRRDQTRIFDEFTRAENVPLESGVGLGLSVVDRACRLLDHQLSVRSKPGVGSVFCIEIDVVKNVQPVVEAPKLLNNTEDVPLNYIVMVIENDPDVLYGTVQWLENWGASVLAAAGVAEAMSMLDDLGMAPDIILADYQLDDGETGVEGIRAVREATGVTVPAIVITADRSVALRREGLPKDVSVLSKPVKLSRLRPLIDWKVRWHVQSRKQAAFSEPGAQTKVDDDSRTEGHKTNLQGGH
ncbi:PAS-domain containing protein [uncultured Roseobacter sp.]|uniref:PAS-domain containing protein n=1 Tax=uncultured Roseobacter sp. TaxID=114847 RepID=UPI0026314D25|nr:PAS-domain containing protein [uncultured Roseobacter sp.]